MFPLLPSFFNIFKRIEKNKSFQAITQGLFSIIPIMIIGSYTMVLKNFPIPSVRVFVTKAWDGMMNELLTIMYNVSFGMIAVYIVMSISLRYARTILNTNNTIVTMNAISSLICYLVIISPSILYETTTSIANSIIAHTNENNVLMSVIVALISTKIFTFVYQNVRNKDTKHNIFETSFTNFIHTLKPTVYTVLVFGIFSSVVIHFCPNHNLTGFLVDTISHPFYVLGDSFLGGFVLQLSESTLWAMGVHGSNVFNDILKTVYHMDFGDVVSNSFFENFIMMGGCGCCISFMISVFLFSKNKDHKKLCKLACLPIAFNINEIIVFGFPIAFNIVYIIPFIIAPLVMYSFSYFAIDIGLVPKISNGTYLWTTPILISGYLATDSIMGTILQLVNIAIGVAIYSPFVKLYDNYKERVFNTAIDDIKNKVIKFPDNTFTTSQFDDFERRILGEVTTELYYAIYNDKIKMFYQPIVCDGQIVAAEALMRFNCKSLIQIYPPILLQIARENNFLVDLTKNISSKIITDLKIFLSINPDVKVFMNLNQELLLDNDYMNWLYMELDAKNIPAEHFGIEIIKNKSLNNYDLTNEVFKAKSNGLLLSLDNWDKEINTIYNSENYPYKYIKISGAITNTLNNPRSVEIVNSLIQFGKDMNCNIIAERIETDKQYKTLYKMNCTTFQGWYFYKSLPFNEFCNCLSFQSTKS